MSQGTAPIIYSTIDPVYLSNLLSTEYLIPNATVALIRRGFNDVYLVQSPTQQFVLRIYLHDKYWISEIGDIQFELDLLEHLHAQDIPVSYPLKRKNGSNFGILQASEGSRVYALFTIAPGDTVSEYSQDLLFKLGQKIAQLHQASATFTSPYSRYKLDCKNLVELPLQRMSTYFTDKPEELAYLKKFAEEIITAIKDANLPKETWGYVHGDLHSGNIHYANGGFTFFDFDHGGFGWRGYDLAPILNGAADNEQRKAFIAGYESINPLLPQEIDLLPTFIKARTLWDDGDIFAMVWIWGLGLATPQRLDNIIDRFKSLEQRLASYSFK